MNLQQVAQAKLPADLGDDPASASTAVSGDGEYVVEIKFGDAIPECPFDDNFASVEEAEAAAIDMLNSEEDAREARIFHYDDTSTPTQVTEVKCISRREALARKEEMEGSTDAVANSCVNCAHETTCGYSLLAMQGYRSEFSFGPCVLGNMSNGNPFFEASKGRRLNWKVVIETIPGQPFFTDNVFVVADDEAMARTQAASAHPGAAIVSAAEIEVSGQNVRTCRVAK